MNQTAHIQSTASRGVASSIHVVDVLDHTALTGLGLTHEDLPQVREMAARIQPSDPMSVAEFGRDVAEHTSRYADELLAQVRNKDLDEAGAKLGQVVSIARGLNVHALSDRRSRIPVVGRFIDKARLKANNVMGQFETTKQQIDSLVSEVGVTQKSLGARNVTLETMFQAVKDEQRLLGLHIAAGKVRLSELQHAADSLRIAVSGPTDVQQLADLDAVVANLDIRVGSLLAMQQSALQTLPQIRMIQASNQVLVDKFHTIKEVTVPAWKRQFMLALSLNEQQTAVQLATAVDDATNDLLRRNAELLHRNAVGTAKANQRLVIDVETLKHVQDTLIKTVEDVIKIQQDGAEQRRSAEKQIEGMRGQLQQRLTRSGVKEAA